MKEINYLMMDQNQQKAGALAALRLRPQMERLWWHDAAVTLWRVPAAWAGTRKIALFAQNCFGGPKTEKNSRTQQGDFWVAPELDTYFEGYRQPVPDPRLAAFMLREQPFREILILLTDEMAEGGKEWWQETFLQESFGNLNGLYLIGTKEKEREASFFDWMYEQSGLLTCFTDKMPVTDGRRTAVADLRRKRRPPVRELASGSLYVDFTSDPEKQRLLRAKRTDISYISARNYLDTAFKARYNAF